MRCYRSCWILPPSIFYKTSMMCFTTSSRKGSLETGWSIWRPFVNPFRGPDGTFSDTLQSYYRWMDCVVVCLFVVCYIVDHTVLSWFRAHEDRPAHRHNRTEHMPFPCTKIDRSKDQTTYIRGGLYPREFNTISHTHIPFIPLLFIHEFNLHTHNTIQYYNTTQCRWWRLLEITFDNIDGYNFVLLYVCVVIERLYCNVD